LYAGSLIVNPDVPTLAGERSTPSCAK